MLTKLFKSITSKGPFIGDYARPMMRKGPFIGDYARPMMRKGPFIGDYAKPMGKFGVRWYTNAAIYEPKFWSASIKNGYSNISTFPSWSSLGASYLKEIHNMFGALTAVTTVMVIWPATVRMLSNFIDDVPAERGAQVKLEHFGIFGEKPTVEIPNTYVHLTKHSPIEE
ncbi:hypothetical protein DFJ63DRAFT_335786 [Scheffersomyces coipomensis]|uniref:uncharacterized protein n=1 Tax=Scheffersomyces coipomensis TaxID=1788519 RepID=UPI00315D066C